MKRIRLFSFILALVLGAVALPLVVNADTKPDLTRITTVDEAVAYFMTNLSAEMKSKLRQTKREDLIQYHFSWGMWIRNNFGLWSGNANLLRSACGQDAPCHPDDASMVIIERVWEALQKTQ